MSIHDDWPGTIAYPCSCDSLSQFWIHGGKLDTSLGATLMVAAELANSIWPVIMTLKHIGKMKHYLLNSV